METTARPAAPRFLLLVIAYLGFISLGLPDAVIGVAWPSVRETFELPNQLLGLFFVVSGFGYFISSFFTGRLLKAIGIGTLLAGSSALVALSNFGYATSPLWLVMLGCAVFYGLGSGAIDAGLNNFVAHNYSARQMNWLHACYMLGATLGPMLMTLVLAQSGSWRIGYAVIAAALLALSLLFFVTRRQWVQPVDDEEAEPAPAETMLATLRLPAVWLQMAVYFFYTGLEVTLGQWSFTMLTESRGMRPEIAGMFVTAYWASLGVGRVLFGLIVNRLSIDLLLRACTVTAIIGCVLVAIPSSGFLPLVGMILAGLALVPVYPCLMTRTPGRFGVGHAAHAIGFQVSAAMIGAAMVPLAVGLIAGERRLELVAVCSIVVAVVITLLHELLLFTTPTEMGPSAMKQTEGAEAASN